MRLARVRLHRRPIGSVRIDAMLWLTASVLIACAVLKLRPKPVPPPSLLDRRIVEIRLDRMPLDQAIETLGKAAGVSIVMDRRALTTQADLRAPITLHFRDVTLRAALAHLPLGGRVFEDEGAALRITTLDALPAYSRLYDVRDIVDRMMASRFKFSGNSTDSADRDSFITEFAESLSVSHGLDPPPVQWAGAGLVMIRGPRRTHDAFETLLRRLRASDKAYPWTPEPPNREHKEPYF